MNTFHSENHLEIKSKRRYLLLSITFINGCRFHFSFISTWLKVGHCFPSVAFDSCLVISPDFQKIKREIRVGWSLMSLIIHGKKFSAGRMQFMYHQDLAASTSLSNSPRYIYLHESIAISITKTHLYITILDMFLQTWKKHKDASRTKLKPIHFAAQQVLKFIISHITTVDHYLS